METDHPHGTSSGDDCQTFTIRVPSFARTWAVTYRYDRTFSACVSHGYTVRNKYGQLNGDNFASAYGFPDPQSAIDAAAAESASLVAKWLEESEAKPPPAPPQLKSAAPSGKGGDDLLKLIGL